MVFFLLSFPSCSSSSKRLKERSWRLAPSLYAPLWFASMTGQKINKHSIYWELKRRNCSALRRLTSTTAAAAAADGVWGARRHGDDYSKKKKKKKLCPQREREYFWFRFCVYLLLTDFVGRILDGASQCVRVSLSRTRTSMDGSIFQFYAYRPKTKKKYIKRRRVSWRMTFCFFSLSYFKIKERRLSIELNVRGEGDST